MTKCNMCPSTNKQNAYYNNYCYIECMGNVMYLVEAAVKPLEKKENGEQIRDIVRDLFYGKARQILTYEDTETSKQVRKVQEEDFSHVIVDASEGKDLYDGLDEYFFADRVEDFRAGRGAMREVTVSTFPPIFQIQVQVNIISIYMIIVLYIE